MQEYDILLLSYHYQMHIYFIKVLSYNIWQFKCEILKKINNCDRMTVDGMMLQ